MRLGDRSARVDRGCRGGVHPARRTRRRRLRGLVDDAGQGTTIVGIDVGGMAEGEATRMLGAKSRSLEQSPVSFTPAGRSFGSRPRQLGVRADWQAAVRQAAAAGDGARPLRGLRRLRVRFFGAHVQPRLTAYPDALSFEVHRIAAAVQLAKTSTRRSCATAGHVEPPSVDL